MATTPGARERTRRCRQPRYEIVMKNTATIRKAPAKTISSAVERSDFATASSAETWPWSSVRSEAGILVRLHAGRILFGAR